MRAFGAALVVLAATVACGSATGSSSLRTGLYGTVTKGPLTPVCTVDTPCQGPAADLQLIFSRNGKVVARTKTRDNGTYRIALGPGRYVVRAGPTSFSAEPGMASVPRKGFRRVDFFVDTGIR
jgi:hypothetical protein